MVQKTHDSTFDAIVIGAGPAGCAAATILAQNGRRVALLERESFPRYRVGESLLPYCWFPLERMGLIDAMRDARFTTAKHSVQFASLSGKISQPYYFFQHDEHESSYTWQVVRSEFDQLLLDNAVAKGALLHERTTAKELLWRDEAVVGVTVEDAEGVRRDLHAPVTIDASGRDIFAQSKNRWRVGDEKLRKVAIWTYYEGALRDPGLDEGATTVAYVPEKGWFWYIPLPGDRVSCGLVAEPEYLYRGDTRDPREVFEREIPNQPWIQAHLAPGRPTGEFRVTADFTYRSRHCATDGLVLVGDAFSFLDPVFSSGVLLALQSGVMAADAIEEGLAAGDLSAERFKKYGAEMACGIEPMRRLVHAFYDQDFNFGEFLRAHPERARDVTDCLIGNLFKDFSGLFEDMASFAELPGPLMHGAPKVVERTRERAG